jgi:hypothetical protein
VLKGRSSGWPPAAAAIIASALFLVGCGNGSVSTPAGGALPNSPAVTASPVMDDPGFGHVHALGVNPADGALYAATHYGLWRLPPSGQGPVVRVADRYQDTMGFTVAGPDRFLGSGHPDLRENLPALLGLMESTDRGQSWRSVSLLGEVDFHAIEAKHGQIFGYDATSETFLVSADGKTWDHRAQVPAEDFTVAPARAELVLVTGRAGLLRSTDQGRTFVPLPGSPRLVVLDWTNAGLYGLAADGSVWVGEDSGDSWQRRGGIGGKPEAITVTGDGRLFAAGEHDITVSADGGRSFTTVVRYAGSGTSH